MLPTHLQTPARSSGRIRPTFAVIALWLLSTLAIVVVMGFLLWNLRASELARAEREIDNLSQVLAEQTARAVQGVEVILRETEDRLKAGQASGLMMDEASIHTLLRARVGGAPQVRSLSVFDADGRLQRTSARFPAPNFQVGDRDYFTVQRDAREARPYIGKPIRDRLDDVWSFPMSRRLASPAGDFAGVVVAAIDPAYFEQLYASIRLGEGSEVALYMRDGTLIAGHPRREEAIAMPAGDSPVFSALRADMAAARDSKTRRSLVRTSEESPQLVAYREVAGLPLIVVVAERENTALAGWSRQAAILVGGAAGVIVLLTLAALALGSKLAREEALIAALRDSQSQLQGIIGSAMDAIITVDETGMVVLFNPSAEKMFRCTQAEAIGASFDRFIPGRYRAAHAGHMQRFGTTGVSSRSMGGLLDIVACRADGEEFPADISISQLAADGRKMFTAMVRDVTQRKAAENALRDSHQQLRALSASLQSVREEERMRIARELHDDLGQHLSGLKMDLSWMESRLRDGQPALLAKIDGMKQLIDATVVSMRRIAAELRPSILDDLGLAAAIEWLAQEFSQRSGVVVKLDLGDGDAAVDEARATTLFRIVQESLTNVARHAEASEVRISLKQTEQQLLLEVQDDGRGMPGDAAQKAGRFGLIGIRERAYLFGGQLRITSRPGAGTTIAVTLPLAAPAGLEQPA